MKRKYVIFAVLSVLIMLFCAPAMAAGTKFVRAYRDNNYDMYVNRMNIIQNKGMVSFWVKSVYSDQGKALVRNELPKNTKKRQYSMGWITSYSTQKRASTM